MRQLITPTPNIKCWPGWCLMYVRQAFGLPARYPTATAAWEASTSQHRDYDFPAGMWVPLWFGLHKEPAGHVALRAPNGNVYSTSDLSNTPHRHRDLADLMAYYAHYEMPLTYRGWTEDVASYPVMAPAAINVSGTTTPTSEEDDMSLTPEQFLYHPIPKYDMHGTEIGSTSLAEVTAWNEANFTRQRQLTLDAIRETVLGVLTTEITNVATGGATSLGTEASWAAWNAQQLRDAVDGPAGEVPEIDAAAIADAISVAIAAKLTAEPIPGGGIPTPVPGPAGV